MKHHFWHGIYYDSYNITEGGNLKVKICTRHNCDFLDIHLKNTKDEWNFDATILLKDVDNKVEAIIKDLEEIKKVLSPIEKRFSFPPLNESLKVYFPGQCGK